MALSVQPATKRRKNQSHVVYGKHLLVEFFGCDQVWLDDRRYLRELLQDAAEQAGATVLSVNDHKFHPQGVTAILLLAESHMSIHTWPEHGYAAVDIYTCGQSMHPELAVPVLEQGIGAAKKTVKVIKRGGVVGL